MSLNTLVRGSGTKTTLCCLLSLRGWHWDAPPHFFKLVTASGTWERGGFKPTSAYLKGPIWAKSQSLLGNSESIFETTSLLWAWSGASVAHSRSDLCSVLVLYLRDEDLGVLTP